MPRWALGRLCDLMVEIVRIQETDSPALRPAAVVVLAGDHGIASEGVSAYPSEITGLMVANFLRGGAAISLLAKQHRLPLRVVDMGTATAEVVPGALSVRLAKGTKSFLDRQAMSLETATEAVAIGRQLLDRLAIDPGTSTLLLGEMGIGNTTSSAALAALLLDRDPADLVGRGTLIDEATLAKKIDVVRRAVTLHAQAREPLEVLAAVGGFELAGMVGMMLEAAERGRLLLLDGFPASVAALVASRIDPGVRDVCIASHRSAEPGHDVVLEALGLVPVVEMRMRLGEASGAALAWPLLESAVMLYREMATFDDLAQ
ncbi:Nicotinate-nucleotide--dimethylbenzimidazole phosphoribosyltransferase [Planctomycetes bacterium Pan216]|uniref:Nicotinate-nucleotide--dimethylbenzimidazole phosphoribosyltransferase n=2 Tax=Kolteria novifilia TaxID=2527975 RepID=A0A518AYU3_9BACT|nr:Nicotinate-nucleotide--dimethylbenzimidazole phosphoribosyltransferase [Planctomycetes bacterium Pan216]